MNRKVEHTNSELRGLSFAAAKKYSQKLHANFHFFFSFFFFHWLFALLFIYSNRIWIFVFFLFLFIFIPSTQGAWRTQYTVVVCSVQHTKAMNQTTLLAITYCVEIWIESDSVVSDTREKIESYFLLSRIDQLTTDVNVCLMNLMTIQYRQRKQSHSIVSFRYSLRSINLYVKNINLFVMQIDFTSCDCPLYEMKQIHFVSK